MRLPRPQERGKECAAARRDTRVAMKKKRKALLLSAGYGRGHHSAAYALAEELQARGWQAQVADTNAAAKPALFHATRLFYNACVRHAPWVWGLVFAQIDRANWASLVHSPGIAPCMHALRRRLQKEKPHLVICTYPLYAYMLDVFAAEGWFRTPYVVVVTDALVISRPWLQTRAPLICLPDEHSLVLMQARYAPADGRLIAPGFPVRAAFCPGEQRPTPGALGEGLHIVYGAHAPLERVVADVQAMLAAWPCMRLSLLAGEREKKLGSIFGSAPAVRLYGPEQDPAPLLRSAHFYIGKAGAATLFEAYATETPVIINYTLPGQEEGNLQLLELDGAGLCAESTADLIHALRHLLDRDAAGRQRMCRAMRSSHRTGGARNIIDAIEGRFFS